jgi:hypothetical protein
LSTDYFAAMVAVVAVAQLDGAQVKFMRLRWFRVPVSKLIWIREK